MQSPRYVAKYGAIRFLSCPGRAAIVSKFRAVSGTACKMPSPTPPKSAKVELRFSAVDFESPSQPPDQSARHYGGLPFPLTGLRDLSSWLASSCQQKSSSLECVDATR